MRFIKRSSRARTGGDLSVNPQSGRLTIDKAKFPNIVNDNTNILISFGEANDTAYSPTGGVISLRGKAVLLVLDVNDSDHPEGHNVSTKDGGVQSVTLTKELKEFFNTGTTDIIVYQKNRRGGPIFESDGETLATAVEARPNMFDLNIGDVNEQDGGRITFGDDLPEGVYGYILTLDKIGEPSKDRMPSFAKISEGV